MRTRFMCRITLSVSAAVMLLLSGTMAYAAPASAMMDVNFMGMKIGKLAVSDYEASNTATTATAKVTANFTAEAGKEAAITAAFPQGLSWMQTVMTMFDQQQQIFRDKDGNDLPGTFSDPPQGGYTLPDGTKQFDTDNTPWYSSNGPAAGQSAPPSFDWSAGGGPMSAQMYDGPTIPLNDQNGKNGFLTALNGKDGMLKFETALVGVKSIPEAGMELTGEYGVVVLKTFTWGINFKFMDNGMGGIDADDYVITAKDLSLGTEVTQSFKDAFDDGTMEWDVNFIPTPAAAPAGAIALIGLLVRRRRAA